MDREIKFRGKRKDNGEWVYGYYFKSSSLDKHYIHLFDDSDVTAVEVIPETVGQFTGLSDRRGKEAYIGQRLMSDSGKEYEIVWINMMAAVWVIETEYPYKKYTAEIIAKCEVIFRGGG